MSILSISKPESANVSSSVDMNITIQHSYLNLTEVSIIVKNADSEIIVEETDSLTGVGTEEHNLSFIAPSEAGQHFYTVYVESEISNSTVSTG